MQDSQMAAVVKHYASMAATQLIAARFLPQEKARFRVLAERQQLTESALLKRLVHLTLQSTWLPEYEAMKLPQRASRDRRLYVRLRPDDQLLLRERAITRGMAAATYASVLLRAHLRSLSPLPKEELLVLKRSVAELGAIGRNLNQLARAANQGARVTGPNRDDVLAMLKMCEGLRDEGALPARLSDH